MPLTLLRADTLLDGTGAPAIRGGAAMPIEDGTIRGEPAGAAHPRILTNVFRRD
jgi:hypothetical protein